MYINLSFTFQACILFTLSPFGPAGPGIPGGPMRPFKSKKKIVYASNFNKHKDSKCYGLRGKKGSSRSTSFSEQI